MASERNYQAIAGQKSKNLTSSMGLTPSAAATGVMRAPAAPAAGPTQSRLSAMNAGRVATPAVAPADTGTPDPNAVDRSVSSFMTDVTPMAAAEPAITEETLRQTSEYLARERALQAALGLFNETQANEGTRFGETYNKNLSDLGWRGDVNDWDYGQLLNQGEKATESGRAFQSLANDFAARGMLQSGAYQGARSILQNQLNDKRTAVETGKTNFGIGQEEKRKAFLAEQEQARTQALADARASLLGGMGA